MKVKLFLLSFCFIFCLAKQSFAQTQSISAGTSYSLFHCSSGSAMAVGANSRGQLGDGTSTNNSNAVPVNAGNGIIAIASGDAHSLFLKNDSTVWVCGSNSNGQFGDGTTTGANPNSTPVQIGSLSGITAIAAGGNFSLFLKSDSTVWVCGSNSNGQLGDTTTVDKNVPAKINSLSGIIAIAAGYYHSLFLKSDGTVWACGSNFSGELGDGTNIDSHYPVQVTGLSGITGMAAGYGHSIFLKNDGTVWTCGDNTYGQLGDGTTNSNNIATKIISLGTSNIKVACGFYHSLVVTSANTVMAFGNNTYGLLGDGTTTNQTSPVAVNSLTGITDIAGGAYHSVFLRNDGTVWACGYNNNGQLGDGTTVSTNTGSPVQVTNACPPCIVTIPDANFKSYLLGNGAINTNNDGEIQCWEAAAFNGAMYMYNSNISDLTGIEAFTALTYLSVDGNNLTSLNLSSNVALTDIYCQGNQLTSLNVTGLTALYAMNCSNNQLASLDVSTCSGLTNLTCHDNLMTSFDVSACSALTTLDCSVNQISSLTLNSAMGNLNCSGNQLTAINTASCTNLSVLDCSGNLIGSLDVSGNPNLQQLNSWANYGITSINVSSNPALQVLNCSSGSLTILDVTNNPNLTTLIVQYNGLTTLDLSNNTALTTLGANFNSLTTIDLSVNTALTTLTVQHNHLWNLDVSNNHLLTYLDCGSNFLEYLNIKNVNDSAFTTFDATGNPQLTCIEVNDTAYANANWSGDKDSTAHFNLTCPSPCLVTIPDTNFKTALLASPANLNNDAEIQCLEAATYTGSLNVAGYSITDLTGIGSFTGLTQLICRNNNLTGMDLSANTQLTDLDCGNNPMTSLNLTANTALINLTANSMQLSALDVTANAALAFLDCSNNLLTSLNTSNPALTNLTCNNNQLTGLNVSGNPNLNVLNCFTNQITALNVSSNASLTSLYCDNNQLSMLDVSANTGLINLNCNNNSITPGMDLSVNTSLVALNCSSNQLTYLIVKNGNNTGITSFNATNNPSLGCVEVDSVSYANANWSGGVDVGVSFSTNCAAPVAVFSANPASGCVPQTVNFTNSTTGALTYNWDFGDGNVSTLQNPPSDVYSSAGIYTVTLIATNGYGSDTAVSTVAVNNLTDIFGTLSYSSGNVAGANVFLIAQGTSSALYDTIATTVADGAGLYTFTTPPPGNYYVRAEAGGAFPSLINTYFGDKYLWDSALVISHGCTGADTGNIMMVELPAALTGPCSLSGFVYETAGFGQKPIAGTNPVIMTNAIPGVPVKVGRNPSGTIVASGTTDSSGYFSFSNLPYDTYTIYTDIPGYPMDSTYTVALSSGNENATDLDYFVDSNSVYIDLSLAVKNSGENSSALSVFPNPTSGSVYVRFSSRLPSGSGLQLESFTETIRLYDLSGRMIYSSVVPGSELFHLDLNELGISSGTYLLDVEHEGKKFRINFVK